MLITDQVATAPCTDPIQDARPSFEAKALKPSLLRPALTLAAVLDLDVLFRRSSTRIHNPRLLACSRLPEKSTRSNWREHRQRAFRRKVIRNRAQRSFIVSLSIEP